MSECVHGGEPVPWLGLLSPEFMLTPRVKAHLRLVPEVPF